MSKGIVLPLSREQVQTEKGMEQVCALCAVHHAALTPVRSSRAFWELRSLRHQVLGAEQRHTDRRNRLQRTGRRLRVCPRRRLRRGTQAFRLLR